MIQLRDSNFAMTSYHGGNSFKWHDLGHDGVIAMAIDEDHSLVDVITKDTPHDTAQTLAHNPFVVVHEDYTEESVIQALMVEHELYRNCFGIV